MTSKTIKRMILAAVLAAPLLVALLASPTLTAWAATKVFEAQLENVPVFMPGVDACSASDDFDGKLNLHIVVWDNGKDDLTDNLHGLIVDSATGKNLGTFHDDTSSVINPGALPVVIQVNIKVTCDGTGQIFDSHVGFTVDKNGAVHFHS